MVDTAIAICTVLYKSGLPYLREMLDSVKVAATHAGLSKVQHIFAVDDLTEVDIDLWVPGTDSVVGLATRGSTYTAVRNVLLDLARTHGAEILIYVDMDDIVLPNGIALHLDALKKGDLSFGDMTLMDSVGKLSQHQMFSGCIVPTRVVGSAELVRHNFMGLSNTAMHHRVLVESQIKVPEHLIATDWWIYTTLLDQGWSAHKTAGSVIGYRQHSANLLGGMMATDATVLARRLCICRNHLTSLPMTASRRETLQCLMALESFMQSSDGVALNRLMIERPAPPGVWFDDVFHFAKLFGCHPGGVNLS